VLSNLQEVSTALAAGDLNTVAEDEDVSGSQETEIRFLKKLCFTWVLLWKNICLLAAITILVC